MKADENLRLECKGDEVIRIWVEWTLGLAVGVVYVEKSHIEQYG